MGLEIGMDMEWKTEKIDNIYIINNVGVSQFAIFGRHFIQIKDPDFPFSVFGFSFRFSFRVYRFAFSVLPTEFIRSL
jgi:hypothetical protein